MTTRVLFMCPHAAGKSLAAATYFRAAAARAGLDAVITVAGPEPDDVNMANVVAALQQQGYTIDWHPSQVTPDAIEGVDVLVSIGCEPTSIPTDRQLVEWDVPLLSADFTASMQGIHDHAEALAKSLSA